jgi:hypothetical protein
VRVPKAPKIMMGSPQMLLTLYTLAARHWAHPISEAHQAAPPPSACAEPTTHLPEAPHLLVLRAHRVGPRRLYVYPAAALVVQVVPPLYSSGAGARLPVSPRRRIGGAASVRRAAVCDVEARTEERR